MDQKRFAQFKFRNTFAVLLFVLFLSSNCLGSQQYEKVKTDVQNQELVFYPDEHSSREPMPLNTTTTFAAFHDKWGVVWNVAYRETGLSAINSTRVTRVIYLSVIDDQLNQFTDKPITIHKFEGRLDHDIFPTDRGFAVAYVNYVNHDDQFECSEFDLSQSKIVKNDGFCFFNHASKILKTDSSYSDYAMAYRNGYVYAASYDNGMKVLRSKGKNLKEVLFEIQGTGTIEQIRTADLYLDETGVFLTWSEDSWSCHTPECASLYFAYCSFENKSCLKNKMNITGDSPEQLKTKFQKMREGPIVLVQFGNDVWKQNIDHVSRKLGTAEKLFKMSSPGKSPGRAELTCTLDECFIFFYDQNGGYYYSTLSGLHKRPDEGFSRETLCGDGRCLEQSSVSGVSFFGAKK